MKKLVMGAVLGVLCATAQADNGLQHLMENLYGGLTFGPGHYSGYCGDPVLASGVATNQVSCENTTAPGYKFWGGWRMSPLISGEVAYINFERAQKTVNQVGMNGTQDGHATRVDGFLFNMAFHREFTDGIEGIGRVGLARLHIKPVTSTIHGSVNSSVEGSTAGDTSPYLGLAVNVDARKMFERFMPVLLDGFMIEAAVDMSYAKINDQRRAVRLWSVGGGFQF